jgi:hypothetical protein
MTIDDFNNQFKFFDRQGARAFQTLVTQLPKVEAGLDNIINKSAGVTDELSNIVRSDFAAQFERGKQAALALGRSLIEPLKPALLFFANLAVSVKELFDKFPAIAWIIAWVGGIVGGLALLISAFRATIVVFTVLADTVLRNTAALYGNARAQLAASASFLRTGRAASTATTAVNALTAATGANSASSAGTTGGLLTLGKSASRLAGGFGVVLTVILTLIPVFAAFNDTSAESNRELENISANLSELTRESDSLDRFADKIKQIGFVARQSGTDAEIVGQQIRDAYNEAGENVSNYAIIAGRTNKQLGQQADEILKKTNAQIELERRVREDKIKTERERGRKEFGTSIKASVSESDIKKAADAYYKAVKSAANSATEDVDKNFFYSSNFKGLLNTPLTKGLLDQKDVKKASQEFKVEADKVLKNIQEKMSGALQRGEYADTDEAIKDAIISLKFSKLDTSVVEYLTAELYNLQNQLEKVVISFESFEDIDNFEATLGAFNKVVAASSKTGTNVDFFNSQIKKALEFNKVLDKTDFELTQVKAALRSQKLSEGASPYDALKETFVRGTLGNEVKPRIFDIGVDPESLKKIITDAFSQAKREKLLSQDLLDNLFLAGQEDAFKNPIINLETLAEISKRLGQSIGENGKGQRELTAGILESAVAQTKLLNAAKLTAQATQANFKMVEEQARLQLELNDTLKARGEIDVKGNEIANTITRITQELKKAGLENRRAEEIATLATQDRTKALKEAKIAIDALETSESPTGDNVNDEMRTAREEAIKLINQGITQGVEKEAQQQREILRQRELNDSYEIGLETIRQTSRGYSGQIALLKVQQSITAATNKRTIDFLIKSRKLIDGASKEANISGLIETVKMMQGVLEERKQIQQGYLDENVAGLQTLSTIEKMLNPKNPMAGIGEAFDAILIQVDHLVEKNKELNFTMKDDKYFSQRLKNNKELVEKLGEMLELEKQFKEFRKESAEKEKEINKYVEDRISAHRDLNDLLGGQVNEGQKILEEAIKRQFDIDEMARGEEFFRRSNQVAEKLAAVFGTNAVDVQRNIDMYIKAYADLVRQGKQPAIDFGGTATPAMAAFQKLSGERKKLNDSLIQARDAEMNLAKANFEQAFKRAQETGAAEDIKLAQEAAEKYKNTMQQLKEPGEDGVINTDAFVKATDEFVTMLERLQDLEQAEFNKINITLEVSEARLNLLREKIENALRDIRVDVKTVFQSPSVMADAESMPQPSMFGRRHISGSLEAALQGKIKSDWEMRGNIVGRQGEILSKHASAIHANTAQLLDLTDLLKRFGGEAPLPEFDSNYNPILQNSEPTPEVSKATGGMIYGPGTKNSDSILAALSTGEYVVRADAVSHYGTEFLNALNSKRLGRFADGVQTGPSVAAATYAFERAGTNASRVVVRMAGAAELTSAIRELIDLQNKNKKSTETEEIDVKIKEGRESGVFKFFDKLGDAIQEISSTIFSAMQNILNLQFVQENIAALEKYNEEVSKIGENFDTQISEIDEALQRNKSSYFDYLESLQDAEQERLKSLLEAEKQYQEELKKTSEIAEEAFSNMFKGAASAGGSQLSSAFGNFSQKLMAKGAEFFGSMGEGNKEKGGVAVNLDEAINKISGAFGGSTDNKPFEKFSNALGEMAAKLSPVTDAFSKLGSFAGNFAKGTKDVISGIASFTPGGMLVDYLADSPLLGGVASMAGGGILAGVGALAGPLTSVIGEGIGLATEDPEQFQKFLDEFIATLPEAAEKFIGTVVEALPKIIQGLADMLPVLFTTIANALPQLLMMIANQLPILLESFIMSLIDNLPKIVEALIKALTVGVLKILVVLVKGLAKLMGELPNIIIGLIKGLVEGLLEVLLDPSFWLELGKAIIKIMMFPLFAILDWFNIPTFHTGGVIPGNREDVPIIAQGGEGVLSRQGMLALGGAQALDKLNDGINPFIEDINRYHSGGVVGESMTRDAVIDRRPSMSNNNINTSNNVSVNVSVSGNMSQSQIDQMTSKLVNDIDNKLAKKVQDRDSRLARSISRK